MPALDTATLIWTTALTMLLSAGAILFNHGIKRRVRGSTSWALGYLLAGVGTFLYTTQTLLDPLWSVLLPNLLMVSGFYTLWAGVREFEERKVAGPRLTLAGLAALLLLLLWAGLGRGDFAARVVVVSLLSGGLALLTARELLWPWRRGAVTEQANGVVFALLGLGFIARALGVAYLPAEATLLSSGTHGALTYLLMTAFSVLIAFGFLLMQNSRLSVRLQTLADTDSLTETCNRGAFVAATERLLYRSDLAHSGITMMLVDVDNFERINEHYGRAAGDKVLQDFSRNMRDFFRVGDVIGRVGSEEFAIVLPGVGMVQALNIAERLRGVFDASLIDIGGRNIKATVSIGIAVAREQETDFDAYYRRAEEALQRAKQAGKNRVMVAP